MNQWSHAVLAAAALALPTGAVAQAFDPSGRPLGVDRRAGVSVTLPLGGPAGAVRNPQLELRAVADHRGLLAADPRDGRGWLPRSQPREARIGLTLAETPRLTIGGRELPQAERRLGVSTLGWVAIGVGATLVVGTLLLADALEDASE